ncbi:DUF523 and DUF1722 domain-containing protein [Magnetospira sp. QH-2]|uniref:YbgA family protein n=1 Tax=Magnetospira sp. (strain QH-2) TaxID=1288970 RepID=UPI0003E80DB5|nr:DUF523 and DUF1722 domain-containing protein [Magnetospira sp. QH-2]CCQ75001.1 conserved protein of unknown function [Magnetospira sp. QH-2]
MDDTGIIIGVSTCLMGESVRHDGGHKKNPFVLDQLGQYVSYRAVCPEMAIGLGIPREPIRLVADGDETRLLGTRSATDHTQNMIDFATATAADLAAQPLDGYIFKSKSPSCGLFRVKRYGAKGVPDANGRGLFAEAVTRTLPDMPVEEEGRLNDPLLRETFIECLFAHHRLRRFLSSPWTIGDLVTFHSREKLLLMAHDPATYKSLGQLVAKAKARDRSDLARDYKARFMAGMARKATPGRHANALRHMAGYVKKQIDAGDRAELSDLIEDYRNGLVPLIVPITLIGHFVRRFEIEYLAGQTYLEPHPKELMLRNHA